MKFVKNPPKPEYVEAWSFEEIFQTAQEDFDRLPQPFKYGYERGNIEFVLLPLCIRVAHDSSYGGNFSAKPGDWFVSYLSSRETTLTRRAQDDLMLNYTKVDGDKE